MTDLGDQLKGLADQAVGKAKRAVGELTGRPDIVLDGEAQDALGHRERELGTAAATSPAAATHKSDKDKPTSG